MRRETEVKREVCIASGHLRTKHGGSGEEGAAQGGERGRPCPAGGVSCSARVRLELPGDFSVFSGADQTHTGLLGLRSMQESVTALAVRLQPAPALTALGRDRRPAWGTWLWGRGASTRGG